jgi:phenylalanyl-tRNA synthetase beta chain
MKIGYNWLSQFIKTDLPIDRIGEILTDIGLEVEGISKTSNTKTTFEKVLVGKVTSCVQHPNADKLRVCKVDVNLDEDLQIVCGAPNVAEGQKVIVATHGSVLMPTDSDAPFKIKKGKIRGEVSQGMICALDELGLGNDHDGIHVLAEEAVVGDNPKKYLPIEEEYQIEIGLTPNRADAMSHLGVARDLKAYCDFHGVDYTWNPPVFDKVENTSEEYPVEILTDKCYRYSGVKIENVEVKPSPEWLQKFLTSIDINPTNNLVDISNFVMHHMGQPLHFFDADKIEGNKVVVRQAQNGEKITTLDEREIELVEEDMVICDAQNPMCIAGVMGGMISSVSDSTTSLFVESAFFEPVSVRKTAKRHTFHSDSSFRFERGIDFSTTQNGLEMAVAMIKELCPEAKIVTSPSNEIKTEISDFTFDFSIQKCTRLIGEEIAKEEILKVFDALSISYSEKTEDLYQLTVPSFRNDVTRDVDIIEEIIRIIGYNTIKIPTRFKASLEIYDGIDENKLFNKVADTFVNLGFHEAMNNSLTKKSYTNLFDEHKEENVVNILNPLSQELAIMRQSMLPGLLENVVYNFNHKNQSVRLFEFGKTYNIFNEKYTEQKKLSILLSGTYKKANWQQKASDSNFYQLKSVLEKVLEKVGVLDKLKVKAWTHSSMFDGISFLMKKIEIANIGIVQPKIAKKIGLKKDAFYAEINWDNLIKVVSEKTVYKEVSKFPSVKRDLALVMDEKVTYAEINQTANNAEKNFLTNIDLFDVYRGEKVAEGKKSYAMSFTFSDENQTLQDKVVDKAILKIFTQLQKQLGIELRDGELKS